MQSNGRRAKCDLGQGQNFGQIRKRLDTGKNPWRA